MTPVELGFALTLGLVSVSALIKDETTRIRCAMCASRCPTHAILMKNFEFRRECVTVAARNPKVLYQ
jgi:Pyruvate/2-oxoacid:ferredoxin oxidoreductase delta subunit